MKYTLTTSLLILLFFSIFLLQSCKKEKAAPPVITTTEVTEISNITAVSGGNITYDGGESVTVRGVCWSTSHNPTISDNKTENGSGTGVFTSSVSGLTGMTTYYVKAYATNGAGTSYGNEISFKTFAINDVDGNGYNSVTIGTQTWLTENLKTTGLNDNSKIPLVADSITWLSLTTPACCWYKNDESNNKITYGALYNWYTVNTGKLCPIGWHVPSDQEWTTLTDYLGGLAVAGGKMKEVGTTHWISPNTGATNESGFKSLAAGQRTTDGTFFDFGTAAIWWSSTPYNYEKPFYRSNYYTSTVVNRGYGTLNNVGLSIRCIKN